MTFLCRLYHSSIGKKIFVAGAGLLLCGFLVTHLAGNLFLLVGEEAFNHYAETLEKNPLLIPAEVVLASLFLGHIFLTLALKLQNRAARPVGYEVSADKGARTLGSKSMAATGLLVLAFLIIHIKSFKFGDKPNGLFNLVMVSFSDWKYSLFYVLAMGGIAVHLSHGVKSAFQTLGINHPRYTPLIQLAGYGFAVLISLGFAALPIWAYLSTQACCQ